MEPDELRQTLSGEAIPVVSRQAQVEAISEAAVMADRAGGVVAVLYGRHPTGLPDEFVTTELIVTWQDRAQAKPQPENPVALTPEMPAEPEPEPEVEPEAVAEPELAEA